MCVLLFFFSSRRRHTRCSRDWSSDVCSSDLQREILDFISGHITGHGFAPSFEEIAARFAFRSLATVHEHLTNLERKGYIHRAHNESRAIEVVPPKGQTGATELPLLGLVAAGEPIEAVTGNDALAVPDELFPRRGRSYVLKVRGQSMIDERSEERRVGKECR